MLFSQFLIFGQEETDFIEITNIREDNKPNRNLKLSDTLTLRRWNRFSEDRKGKIKKSILEKQQDIIRDSSKTSIIMYYGKPENLKLILGDTILIDTLLNEPSKKYFYMIDDTASNEATYALTSINRNQGIKDIQLYLMDSKRIAKFKIDTSYSEIYIQASLVLEYSQLQPHKVTEEIQLGTNGLPIAPESIGVIEDDFDQLSVHHRIPKKKHYW